MITAAQWVPRGFAAPFPKKYTLDESEFERIAELAKLQLDDAEEDLKAAQEEDASDADEENTKGEEDGMQIDDKTAANETKFVFLPSLFLTMAMKITSKPIDTTMTT